MTQLLKEEHIRPSQLFDRYLELSRADAYTFFPIDDRKVILCPACGQKGQEVFVKNGFAFQSCTICLTLFNSPRPPEHHFLQYYTEAPSTQFWSSHFYRETQEARREKLWRPKAYQVLEVLKKYSMEVDIVCDIGGGYGIFAEEFQKVSGYPVIVIEPSPQMSQVCRDKGLHVIEKFFEELQPKELPSGKKVFVSFELFEHLHDPNKFLRSCRKLMVEDELFLFTTLSGTGLDIALLKENSKAVFPPHHINFFNPQSIPFILKNNGLVLIECFTPGKLDIEILEKQKEQLTDSFWKFFFDNVSDTGKQELQRFLSEHCLSSHMWTIAKAAV